MHNWWRERESDLNSIRLIRSDYRKTTNTLLAFKVSGITGYTCLRLSLDGYIIAQGMDCYNTGSKLSSHLQIEHLRIFKWRMIAKIKLLVLHAITYYKDLWQNLLLVSLTNSITCDSFIFSYQAKDLQLADK